MSRQLAPESGRQLLLHSFLRFFPHRLDLRLALFEFIAKSSGFFDARRELGAGVSKFCVGGFDFCEQSETAFCRVDGELLGF